MNQNHKRLSSKNTPLTSSKKKRDEIPHGLEINKKSNSQHHPVVLVPFRHEEVSESTTSTSVITTTTSRTAATISATATAPTSRSTPPTPPSSQRKIEISLEDMRPYFYCPQGLAARILGVSVSTLKRRYYELGLGRWPYQHLTQDERRRSVWYLVNEDEPETEKDISLETYNELQRIFSKSLFEQSRMAQQSMSSEQQKSTSGNTNSTGYKFMHYIPKDPSDTKRSKRFQNMNHSWTSSNQKPS